MANVDKSIKNWSVTPGSNQPDGTDPTSLKGDLQALQAGVRYLRSQDTIASGTTTDLGSKDAESLTISGTTTITGLGTVSAGIIKRVVFSGALTLTHNATSLILPTEANITTAAGDTAELESLGAGNWRCNSYNRKSGDAVSFAAFLAQLLSSVGSSLIGFIQAGVGAVDRTVQSKLRESVSVLDFGADLTGATSSTAAFTAACAAAYEVVVPAGVWNLTTTPTSTANNTFIINTGATFTGAGALLVEGLNSARVIFTGNGGTYGHATKIGAYAKWLEAERASTEANSSLVVLSNIGQIAMLGGSRTSDFPSAGSMGCIGIVGYGINDNASQVQTAYAGYFEARRKAGAGITHGIEVDIVNEGGIVTTHPYIGIATGGTIGAWIASGGEVVGAQTATLALGIINNGAAFEKGIVFGATSIAGTDGVTGTGTAIALAKGHTLQWYGAGGVGIGYLTNGVATAANATNIDVSDSGLTITASDGRPLFQVAPAVNTANYLQVQATASGSGVRLNALGLDTDIDIVLAPKGAGVLQVSYGSSPATTPSAFSASRRLAFKDGNNILWYIPISTVAW